MTKKLSEVADDLDSVSSCFCLAKWLQVSIHLQNGQTHSCHHPLTHTVPLSEIAADPSALHNTNYKKEARKQMLEGKRPKECDYCWKIEDSHTENISDRIFKSADYMGELERIRNLPWNESVNPISLEVSFGNECNFKCAYCAPHISSALMSEYQQHGAYKSVPGFSIDELKRDNLYPFSKDEFNPYVEAFWKWWPSVSKDLKLFRLTGGEPLLNSNTFKFLDYIIENPLPHLEIGINSNLGVPNASFEKFLNKIQYIIENKLIKKFVLYSSVDTYGKNGEFVRFGMNYESVMKNIETFLTRVPVAELSFMSTYNVFSVVNFDKFLHDVTALKQKYRDAIGFNRVHLDIPYLRNPAILSCSSLTEEYYSCIRRDVEYVRERTVKNEGNYSLYEQSEFLRLERILHWVESMQEGPDREGQRANLYLFIQEYQKRKSIKFFDYCPEYTQLYASCKLAYYNQLSRLI